MNTDFLRSWGYTEFVCFIVRQVDISMRVAFVGFTVLAAVAVETNWNPFLYVVINLPQRYRTGQMLTVRLVVLIVAALYHWIIVDVIVFSIAVRFVISTFMINCCLEAIKR